MLFPFLVLCFRCLGGSDSGTAHDVALEKQYTMICETAHYIALRHTALLHYTTRRAWRAIGT
jgi:hypothetical protein